MFGTKTTAVPRLLQLFKYKHKQNRKVAKYVRKAQQEGCEAQRKADRKPSKKQFEYRTFDISSSFEISFFSGKAPSRFCEDCSVVFRIVFGHVLVRFLTRLLTRFLARVLTRVWGRRKPSGRRSPFFCKGYSEDPPGCLPVTVRKPLRSNVNCVVFLKKQKMITISTKKVSP